MDNPKKVNAQGQIQTSVLISPEFWHLCKINSIRFSEALRIGISLMLAERGVKEYDNNLNLFRKMNLLRIELEKTSQELNNLKEKYGESKIK